MSPVIIIASVILVGLFRTSLDDGQSARTRESLGLLDTVRAAIESHASVRVQVQEVARADAIKTQAASQFNYTYQATADVDRVYAVPGQPGGLLGLVPTSTSNVAGSVFKPLRNGITVNGTLEMQTRENAVGGLANASAHAAIGLTLPLMRNRGTAVNTATETAADVERDAARLDLRHVTASVVNDVVSSYWMLVAAERSVAVASASAERGRVLTESLQALIDADQLPRSDLAPALANLADRRAAEISAVQARVDARSRLLLASGLRPEDLPERPTLDDFPSLGRVPASGDVVGQVSRLVSLALTQRADYAAAQARLRAVRVLRAAAVNGLLPEVNLSFEFGYASVGRRGVLGSYFSGFGTPAGGPDLVGRLTVRQPVHKTLAQGRLAELDARFQQAELTATELARSIALAVSAAHNAWLSSFLLVQNARQSVREFEVALQGERDKLTLGLGSIVNVLTIEDRLTAASEREVAAWRSFSQALINLRFVSGTVLPAQSASLVIDRLTLTTAPELPQ